METPGYSLDLIRSMSHGNESFVSQLLQTITEDTSGDLLRLENELSSLNWSAIKEKAHSLKSTIDLLDIKSIRQTVRRIEELALARENPKELGDLIHQLCSVTRAVMADIQQKHL